MGGFSYHKASRLLTFSALITAVVFGCEGIKGSLRDSLSNLISVNWGSFCRAGVLQYEVWEHTCPLFRPLQRAALNQLCTVVRRLLLEVRMLLSGVAPSACLEEQLKGKKKTCLAWRRELLLEG